METPGKVDSRSGMDSLIFFKIFKNFFLLFIYAYNVWVISPHFPPPPPVPPSHSPHPLDSLLVAREQQREPSSRQAF
jgi:hypothetical protein